MGGRALARKSLEPNRCQLLQVIATFEIYRHILPYLLRLFTLSCAFSGAVYLLDISRSSGKRWQQLSASKNASSHTRIVFNARCSGADFNSLCTISMDRQIIVWDLKSLKAKYNITTVGGFVYSIDQSPINPGLCWFKQAVVPHH